MLIKVSVIIVTYNSSYIITKCLNELIPAIPFERSEIIVVDNASGDETLEILESFKDKIKIISLNNNIGFAGGINRGISISEGEIILIINPDLIINYECLNGMIDFLSGPEKVGAVAPRLLYLNGEKQPSCRRYPILRAILCNRITLIKRIMGDKVIDEFLMADADNSQPVEVEWVIGACILFRRKALQDVGLFDKEFFLYYEDADWCYRARKMGWKVFYLPKFAATHLYKRESKQGINRQLVWHIMSLLRFYIKHGFRF